MRFLAAILVLNLMACGDPSVTITDAASDVSSDDTSVPGQDAAPMDAGRDARIDAATDSGMDSAVQDAAADAAPADAGMDAADAAPVCECSTGPCCDGCHFRSAAYVCGTNEPFPRSCGNTSSSCGMRAVTLYVAQETLYCSGSSSACNGNNIDSSYNVDCSQPTPGDFQQYGVCMPAENELPARCALNCGF